MPSLTKSRLWPTILLGSFALFLLAMVVLVVVAEVNRPEMVERDPYTRGSIDSVGHYSNLNRLSGWLVDARLQQSANRQWLEVFVVDSLHTPVVGLLGDVALYCLSGSRYDIPRQQLVSGDSGRYLLPIATPLTQKRWEAMVRLTDGKSSFQKRFPFKVQ
ncbi:MAG: FixH family protein [bacterium]|nr:FixH family protein [bacterium]